MADRKYFLLQDSDGVLTLSRCEKDKNGHWDMYGTVPIDEMPPALAVGLGVLAAVRPDEEIVTDADGKFVHCDYADQGGPSYLRIWLKSVEPPEKVGKKWLETLPVGTRILSPKTGCRVVVISGGVCVVSVMQIVRWEHMDTHWDIACPAECPEWEPAP